MTVTRRELMKWVATAPVISRAWAAPNAGSTRFLLVFMRGGYDAASVLIPQRSELYLSARPTIAIKDGFVLPGQGDWALHPSLKDTFGALWAAKQLVAVPFAGTADLTRSHFETQESIELGLDGSGPMTATGSGFLNRLAEVLGAAASAVAFTDGLPSVMKGPVSIPNVSLKGAGKPAFDDRQMRIIASMYAGTPLEPQISEGFELRRDVAKEADAMAAEMQAANRQALTPKGFELEARRMARLMRDKFSLGFIDVGGWDTHVNQSPALATNLENLGRGLGGFAQELGEAAWKNTVVVVLSEFGRTFKENGTRGTDHGHGSAYWVLGGAVKGGRVAGEQVALTEKTLHQGRDWPVLNEYRALLGGLFTRLYGLNADQLAKVFPGARPGDLGVL